MHTLDAQQSDLDEGDGRTGGMAGLSRHLEQDADILGFAEREGCRPRERGSASRSEEHARLDARHVQRGTAEGAPCAARKERRGR